MRTIAGSLALRGAGFLVLGWAGSVRRGRL